MSSLIKDNLSLEYLALLPELRKAMELFVTIIKWHLKPFIFNLKKHERIEIRFRIKECDSAISALERREEFKIFDEDKPEKYHLKDLKDLLGIRVLVFPNDLVEKVKNSLIGHFRDWVDDSLTEDEKVIAWKYHGNIPDSKFQGELQILPMLTGLFWEVEHFVFYKPDPHWKNIRDTPEMIDLVDDILKKFDDFESLFNKIKNIEK